MSLPDVPWHIRTYAHPNFHITTQKPIIIITISLFIVILAVIRTKSDKIEQMPLKFHVNLPATWDMQTYLKNDNNLIFQVFFFVPWTVIVHYFVCRFVCVCVWQSDS